MRITLTPRTEALIQEGLESGRYASANEVVETAVMLLEAQDRFERLRASLIEAEAEVREGKVLDRTPELRQQLREAAAEMARLGIPSDPDDYPR